MISVESNAHGEPFIGLAESIDACLTRLERLTFQPE